jgi:hypothetical protein
VKSLGFVVLLAACGFQASPSQGTTSDANGPGGGSDAGPGSGSDGSMGDANMCFGKGLLKLCLAALPSQPKTLSASSSYDTGDNANCTQVVTQASGPDLCVVAGTTVTVTGNVVATGSRALVLIGTDAIMLPAGATIDVSSKITGGVRKGAAANTGTCSALVHGKNDAGGGGGGAGGSFGTAGGTGGTGDTNQNDDPAGVGTGAAVGVTQTAAVLRGGCQGSAGGDGHDSDPATKSGGPGGDGGGAAYLIAGNTITIAGGVFASGAAGSTRAGSTGQEEGGGGGGSGGMIVLDAPTINVTGSVVANGGGGGGGGSLMSGGAAGGDGTTTSWNGRATGGGGDHAQGGNGGDGAKGTAVNMTTSLDGGDSVGGAGGAAGGLGLIWTYGTVTGGTMMSPMPVPHT